MKIKRLSLTAILLAAAVVIAAGVGYGSAMAFAAITDEVVKIPDPVLENAIRDGLDIHNRDIRASDMARINKGKTSAS